MPKTKNVSRAQWDAVATRPDNVDSLTAATALTALSPPTMTRPRLHTSRTNSHTSTRTRRSKENSENAASEKENSGRVGRSTRTHVTPGAGVLSTTYVSSNTSSLLGGKLAAEKPKKPIVKRKLKKTPLQDVTAQFVASGMGEGANRAGTAFEGLQEEDILAEREGQGNGVALSAPEVERAPPSPLPPSSPPSDFRLAKLEEEAPASPAYSIPVPEYDPWDSFDSARPVGSPSKPVAVSLPHEAKGKAVERDEDEDPFGFAALEKKLKADRELVAHDTANAHQEQEQEEDEDIHALLVADTSSPRPEGLRRVRKRALEDELDEEEDYASHYNHNHNHNHNYHNHHHHRDREASSPVLGVPGASALTGTILSSPVRAAIAASNPASTPAEASPRDPQAHAHAVTPPTPHKEKHKRRRLSSVPLNTNTGANAGEVAHDVFGPCVEPSSSFSSSSSPGRLLAESPSPTKAKTKARQAPAVAAIVVRTRAEKAHDDHVAADALDAFNAVLDAEEAGATLEPATATAATTITTTTTTTTEEAGGRTLRPRTSRTTLTLVSTAADADVNAAALTKKEKEKKSRSASRGPGRGRGASRARGRGASRSKSARPQKARDVRHDGEGDENDDEDEDEVDQDEKFEQERQARIAYFQGLEAYEVEKEDVYLI